MAITVLYQQNFSAGSSTFCSPRTGAGGTLDYYESGSNTTADAQDPLYPDAAKAEAVDVTTGGGPAGENTLDLASGLTGGDDYSTAGIHLHVPAVVTPGSGPGAWTLRGAGVVSTLGRFVTEVWIYATATSIADNTFGPIFELNRSQSGPPSIALSHSRYGGNQHLEIFRAAGYGGGVSDDSYILTGYQDEWVRYQLITGVSTAPGVADGYYQVYVQIGVGGTNALAYSLTGLVVDRSASASVGTTGPTVTAPDYRIATVNLGFFGLFGRAAAFRIYEETTASSGPGPVVDTTTPCDCTPAGNNPTMVPDPLLPFAPVYACTGGGTVEALADLPGIGGCWL